MKVRGIVTIGNVGKNNNPAYRVTLPKNVATELGVKAGDTLTVYTDELNKYRVIYEVQREVIKANVVGTPETNN